MEENKTELNAILRRYAGEIRRDALAAAAGDAGEASRIIKRALLEIRRNYRNEGKTQYGGSELTEIVKACRWLEEQTPTERNGDQTGAEAPECNGNAASERKGGETGAEDIGLFDGADESKPVKKSNAVFARVLLIISIVLAVIMIFLLVVMLMERGVIPKFVDFGFADWFNEHIFKLY